jgi:hypothetical protein
MLYEDNNELKIKGEFDYNATLKSSQANLRICYKAIGNFFTNEKPFIDTINESDDVRDFIIYQKFSKQFK